MLQRVAGLKAIFPFVESASYNAGVRATMPVELVIDMKQGVILFLSESDVMSTSDIVPNVAL